MSTISPRWVGSSVPAPKENGPSPVGRQRHYGAVELAGAVGQVNVNDVVEVDGGGSGQHRPRLVQVLCMWEDTFTGACKVRARRLVYAADLPKDALARLQEARRAFPDENPAGSDVARRHFHESNGDGEGFDADEVFLTADREELDVVRIVKPVTLSVGAATDEPPTKEKRGPRLTHSFDASSGDFTPVEHTDAIAKRARARRAEAVVRASRLAEETAADSNGKPVVQSSGWLLPRQKSTATAVPGGIAPAKPGGNSTPTSVADSESEGNISDSSGPVQKALMPDDMEWEKEEGESDGDSDGDSGSDSDPTDTKCQQPGDDGERPTRARTSSRLRKPRALEDVGGVDRFHAETRQSSTSASSSSPLVTPEATPPAEGVPPVLRDTTVKHQEATRKRPRRLAMPPIKEKPAAVAAVATRQSKRRPSIAGERKRGRPARATMEGAERYDSPPRRIVVGDNYQADIPDLLSAKEKKKDEVPPAQGTGAKMVWRSIRKWDPLSRGMLSAYFDSAKEVVQNKQARSGVAVHVRLGGGNNNNCSDESRHRKDAGSKRTDLSSSYAVWAVTSGSSPGGVVRVACSAMAQTAIPASAIQRVQSEEEALAALVKARCTLDDFEPALQVLEQELPESIEPWTLSQVRTLEQALEKDFDPDRRLHGWAREGMSMDRDDFIDLARVSKQVPGKTSAQVLSFYYRYLAAAKPLTDVVYGTEAAKARQLEAILPACGNETRPRRDGNNLTTAAKLARAGWQTNSPASRNGKPEASGPLATPDKPKASGASPQPSPSTTKRPRAESRDGNQAAHTLPPPKRCTPPLAPAAGAAPGSSRESAVAVDSHRANATGELRGEYERRRGVPRGQHASRNSPADVEMLEATDFGGGARDGLVLRRSAYPGPPVSAPARASYPTAEARALHPRPRLVAPIDSAPASYGYHADAAVPSLVGRSPQRRPVSHNSTPFRRELVGDDGRDHRHMVNGGGLGVGGGGGGGFSRHDAREDGRPERGLERGDEFGFMAPCWRLLEMAKSFLDQDQLLYMRGLIATHVRKPMTRQQLLERADSCLQDQQEVLAAFVKMFDRVDHARAESQLVPLYQAVKRTRAVQAEPVSMMSHNERLSASTAVHTNPRARASYSSYSRSPALPRTYEAPPMGRAAGGHPGREEVFSRAAPESHPRFVAPGTEAHHQRSIVSDRGGGSGISGGWWREGDSSRSSAPYARGAAAPPAPSMYSPAAPSRSAMAFREERRDRDFDVQGEVMRAWPQHQHQDGSGQWRTGGAASSFSGAAVTADVRAPRPRVPWGGER
ncbi:unnamed protein product [Scytosiphon promiscuus]